MEKRVPFLAVLLPLLLSLAGFVLTMLALFAGTGSQQQALEGYHIIAINMSDFGHDLVPTATTSSSSSPSATETGFWSSIGSDISDIGDKIENDIGDALNDIGNDIADKISDELGISQWYSLHVMTVCEGAFSPNATTPGAGYNTTNCTAQQAGVHFNLTETIYDEISEGPLNGTLTTKEIRELLPDEVQTAVDYLNEFLLALFVFYVLGAAFSGLSFLFCIATLTLRRKSISGAIVLANLVVDTLAVLALVVASAIVTAVSKKGVSKINEKGEDLGISAVAGTKFMIISWVAFAVMFVSLIFWCAVCCVPQRSRGYGAKGSSRWSKS
ncbi:hypothetical protein GGR56DRAFT_623091 [Xylariaceae sp. FL0804]|nr:hypothetical protein GGR56DRAFT_623091 [Xylariaceae sp. FL0804]